MRGSERALLWILAAAGAGYWLYVWSPKAQARLVDIGVAVKNALTPRGIRNNNPGNIEWIASPVARWRGMVRADGRYGVFDTAANGVRAIGGELRASVRKGQLTVAEIIAEWAPPGENDTGSYARSVARSLNVQTGQRFNVLAKLPEFAAAIIQHENGQQPYALADIARWVSS